MINLAIKTLIHIRIVLFSLVRISHNLNFYFSSKCILYIDSDSVSSKAGEKLTSMTCLKPSLVVGSTNLFLKQKK